MAKLLKMATITASAVLLLASSNSVSLAQEAEAAKPTVQNSEENQKEAKASDIITKMAKLVAEAEKKCISNT